MPSSHLARPSPLEKARRDSLAAGLPFQTLLQGTSPALAPLPLPTPRYLAVYLFPVARLHRGLQQLPGAPLVKGDDGAHVLLAEGAIDQSGDVDAPHAFDAMEVRKGLVGKIPARKRKGRISESQPPWVWGAGDCQAWGSGQCFDQTQPKATDFGWCSHLPQPIRHVPRYLTKVSLPAPPGL